MARVCVTTYIDGYANHIDQALHCRYRNSYGTCGVTEAAVTAYDNFGLGNVQRTTPCTMDITARPSGYVNPLKCSGVKQLHLKVFNAIQV